MCWFRKKPVIPTLEAYDDWVREQVYPIVAYETTWYQVRDELAVLGIKCMYAEEDLPDFKVVSASLDSLIRMIPFLTYPADNYVAEVADCDDYAMWAASDARRIFKVNGIFQVWGDTPLGFHAWNIARVGDGYYRMFDANAGFPFAGTTFSAGENEYVPKKWK